MISDLRKNLSLLKIVFLALFAVVLNLMPLFGQSSYTRELSWKSKISLHGELAESFIGYDTRTCNGLFLPYYSEHFKGVSIYTSEISISDQVYEPFTGSDKLITFLVQQIAGCEELYTYHLEESGVHALGFAVKALRVSGNKIEKLVRFTLNVKPGSSQSLPIAQRPGRRNNWPSVSVLNSGDWYKFSVDKTGVYRITYQMLQELGLNLGGIDPRTFKIYGHHGQMLPELNSVDRPMDLTENAIQVVGESDGRFDEGDYILFYGEAPDKWVYDSTSNKIRYRKNFYTKESVYFLTFAGSQGKRVSSVSPAMTLPNPSVVNTFNDQQRHEKDLVNHIKSGRMWYGENFDRILAHNFSFELPNRVAGNPLELRTILIARSVNTSNFTIQIGNKTESHSINGLGSLDYTAPHHSNPVEITKDFLGVAGSQLNVTISYNKPLSTSQGWLDYLELHTLRNLRHTANQMLFQSIESVSHNVSEFNLEGSSGLNIWDITDPFNVKIQQTDHNSGFHKFRKEPNGKLLKFISFSGFLTPKYIEKVSNQNLHGIRDVDYVIVVHPAFRDQANKLASFHMNNSGFSVYVITTQQIYNEFSSGYQDITAIRDFMRLLYTHATSNDKRPKYLLLFGDASYDYLDILAGNTNFVPTYQSVESSNPNGSYCSDDYFGLLDPHEGLWLNNDLIDLGIGRFPCKTKTEAEALVEKVIKYRSTEAFGSWKNQFTLVADDMDASWEHAFVTESNMYADTIESKYPPSIINKIYLDAYEQVSLGGGQRYPEAVEAINSGLERGTILWNYMGHGGELGLASERIVEIPQINGWKNSPRLPMFFTATCEFSRFDDPGRTSAGEFTLLNPDGGAIAMLTTTRLVFQNQNESLSRFAYDNALLKKELDGKSITFGEMVKIIKNRTFNNLNDRNFSLLGDPALRLGLPQYRIVLDSLNGTALNQAPDTLKALSKVTFKGQVLNENGQVFQGFEGIVSATVLDKKIMYETRANDPPAVKLPFSLQNNTLYRGRAKVTDGKFEFTFIVPKDISYRFGHGKASMYADDMMREGAGADTLFIVGGSATDAPEDTKGPEIELALNDYTFVSGGLTNSSPLLLARLFDESGINTAGAGIGREILATIDKGTMDERTIVLNDFYEADLDDFQSGEVKYRLNNIPEGKHTLTLKVWDTYNNSSEATIEFIVENQADLVIKNLLNYPNPFSTRTIFHFDHNKHGQDLTVHLQIMTISGRVIKSFFRDIPVAESHISSIEWDARDEFGDKLSKGVYIYRIRVKTPDSKWVDKYEKLVILN
jgi:hypothetical protein